MWVIQTVGVPIQTLPIARSGYGRGGADEAACIRVVIARAVVVQPRLWVELLAGKPVSWVDVAFRSGNDAPRVVLVMLHAGAGAIREHIDAAQMVVMVVEVIGTDL